MTIVGMTLLALSLVGAGVVVAALVACALRRWRLAVVVARWVALAAPVVLVLATLAVAAMARSTDAPAKATALAAGIAEVMNCGVGLLLAALASALVWVFARWRLRLARRRTT
jgi:hypothetical protein